MSELMNEVGDGLENEVVSNEPVQPEKPLSIRDSLVAAMKPDEKPLDEQTGERPRDESGRFTAKPNEEQSPEAGTKVAKPVEQPAAVAQPEKTAAPAVPAPAPSATEALKPPPGWSAEAKASFAELPAHVQAAISKREQEVDNGFKVLQDYKGLEEFTPYVKAAGTTFADSMKRALDWESSLQRDPLRTIHSVASLIQQRTNLPVDQILHPALVAHLSQQAPQQQAQAQPFAAAQQPVHQQQPVNVDEAIDQAFRKRDVENQLNAFLSDPANVHAETVLEDMAALISMGKVKDLKEAYDTACWMRPDIRQQMISQSAPPPPAAVTTPKANPADQARRAAKSITGSSAPGPSKDAGPEKPTSIRDSLKQAFSQQGTRA